MVDVTIWNALAFMQLTEVQAMYQTIWQAWVSRINNPVEITSTQFDGQATSGVVVINPKDFRDWLDTIWAYLQNNNAIPATYQAPPAATPHLDFSYRPVRT